MVDRAPYLPGVASKRVRSPSSPAHPVELLLALVAVTVVVLVALWFSTSVTRVFDIPKATALKVGGGLGLVGWLLFAAFGPGVRWQNARRFAAPVVALVGAVTLSTIFSLDPWMSFNGVYERQFGLQGYIGCLALFLIASTCLTRPTALAGFALLSVLGGTIGTYAQVQSQGLDPFGWVTKPSSKVFSYMGNANFAGNTLALIFPLTAILACVTVAKVFVAGRGRAQNVPAAVGAGALVLGLQLSPIVGIRGPFYAVLVGASLIFCAAVAYAGRAVIADEDHSRPSGPYEAALAGILTSSTFAILLGLLHTRTRGSWIGSAVAVVLGLLLLPSLFSGNRPLQARLRVVCWGGFIVLCGAFSVWVSVSDSVYARTVRSIPSALDPNSTAFGRGQGTRPYLWSESPRVLLRHDQTMARVARDYRDIETRVNPDVLESVPVPSLTPADAPQPGWRSVMVWVTGIGLETYRYAFMSHKSQRLEALDPMTNHDNPHNNYLFVFASLGLLGISAYLWLLATILLRCLAEFRNQSASLTRRAIGFGVLTSFFSYAVYSFGGFDSVACSVFLFFLLGCASVAFGREEPAPRKKLFGRDGIIPSSALGGLVLVIGIGLGTLTAFRGHTAWRAEHAFARQPPPGGPVNAARFARDRIANAIAINPNESQYRQALGRFYVGQASQATNLVRKEQNERAAKAAVVFAERAEVALYSALHHAWAPENIFITLFQLYSTLGDLTNAEYALQRALQHSPHLPAIRASLAQVELQQGANADALEDCAEVLEVDPEDLTALTVCGQAAARLGRAAEARTYLNRARSLAPRDPRIRQALESNGSTLSQ